MKPVFIAVLHDGTHLSTVAIGEDANQALYNMCKKNHSVHVKCNHKKIWELNFNTEFPNLEYSPISLKLDNKQTLVIYHDEL